MGGVVDVLAFLDKILLKKSRHHILFGNGILIQTRASKKDSSLSPLK